MTSTTHSPTFRTREPFSHIVVFEWHDGPVKGLANDVTSNGVYYFTMLDCDEAMDERVFAFYEVDRSLYDDCVSVLSRIEKPKYPVWCPPVVPNQIDFGQWSRTERATLIAIVGCSRYMDYIVAIHETGAADEVDVAEWNFDEAEPTHHWLERLFGKPEP